MNLIKEQPSFLTNYSDRKKVAKLIEGFFNGKTIRQSANDADINPVTACRLIKENALYKQRSYDTVTLVIYSKINFDEESI